MDDKEIDERNEVKYGAGAQIFKEGEPGGDLLIIKSGEAQVYRERDGKTFVLALVGPGEMLGVMTVLDGGTRTASVRAKSDITAVQIKKHQVAKMVKSIPRWANALISDLVLRVTQADELYAHSTSGVTGGPSLEGPGKISLAVQLAEGFLPLAELLSQGSPDAVVKVDDILKKQAQIMGRPEEDLKEVMNVFDEVGLVTWKKSQVGKASAGSGELSNFGFFASFVKNAQNDHKLADLVSVLAINERKMLKAMVKIAGEKNPNLEAKASISFLDLESAFALIPNLKFETHTLKEAQHLGLLTMDRSGASPVVEFIPKNLDLALFCIEVVRKLDELEDAKYKVSSKRTLVY